MAEFDLTNIDCAVDLAENSEQALQLSKKRAYDLILMDVTLPDGDGRDVSRQIRDDEDSPSRDSVIIIVTPGFIVDGENSYSSAGVDGTLSEPLSQSKIAIIFNTFLASFNKSLKHQKR